MRISLFEIDEPLWPTRQIQNDKVQSIGASMALIGLQTPVKVMRKQIVRSGQMRDGWLLISGRHRVKAARHLQWSEIEASEFHGTEIEARIWEVDENLARAELTALERDVAIAKRIELTKERERQSAHNAPNESKRADGKGHRHEGGINLASKELGIERTEAQRAVKISSLSQEAKDMAVKLKLDDNQAALLAAAKETEPTAQVLVLKDEAKKKADRKEARKRLADADTERADDRTDDRRIERDTATEFAEWLLRHAVNSELPTLISWLQGAKPKDVIAALRRQAA